MPKAAVALSQQSDLIAVAPEQVQMAYAIVKGEADVGFADPETMARAIGDRIAQADTFDDAFAAPEDRKLDAWSDKYMDVPVRVLSLHLNPSQFKDSDGISNAYAVVGIVVLDTGETDTVACGGYNVLMQLIRMVEKGWTDRPVRMIAVPTRSGRDTLYLARVPDDVPAE